MEKQMQKGDVVRFKNSTSKNEELVVVTGREGERACKVKGYGHRNHPDMVVADSSLEFQFSLPSFTPIPKEAEGKILNVEYRGVYSDGPGNHLGSYRPMERDEDKVKPIIFYSVYLRYFDEEVESPLWACVADLYSEEEAQQLCNIFKTFI